MSYASTPSATTFAADKGTVFKVTIERGGEPEMRRVRGDFTFEEMLSIIRHMWNSAPERLVIEYVDEDGDRVRVGSQLEWTEAIQVHADRNERTVRLFARKGRGTRGANVPPAAAIGSSDDEPTVHHSSGTPGPAPSNASISPTITPHPVLAADDVHVAVLSSPMVEATPEFTATLALLSDLYGCDAAKELGNPSSTFNFRPIVTRADMRAKVLDVDKQHLRRLLVSVTNRWIGEGKYENAERNLITALTLWPDDPMILYNLACGQSLHGEVLDSIESLSMAIAHGYNDAGTMLRDADLNNVKDHPGFADLVRRARGEQVACAYDTCVDVEPVEPTIVVARPTVAQESVIADPERYLVDRLVFSFPFMTTEEAETLLRACNYDLHQAALLMTS